MREKVDACTVLNKNQKVLLEPLYSISSSVINLILDCFLLKLPVSVLFSFVLGITIMHSRFGICVRISLNKINRMF